MKKLTLFLTLLLLSTWIQAQQFSADVWHWGELDLVNGQTLKGKIKYNLQDEHVLLIANNVVTAYPINKIQAFAIRDAISAEDRVFYAIPHTLYNNYERNHFFELLSDGQVSLLTRQEIVRKIRYDASGAYLYGSRSYPVLEEEENYFLMDDQGNITSCGNSNREILEYFTDKSKELKEFIKTNKLNVARRNEMVYVVEYYNKLISDQNQ